MNAAASLNGLAVGRAACRQCPALQLGRSDVQTAAIVPPQPAIPHSFFRA